MWSYPRRIRRRTGRRRLGIVTRSTGDCSSGTSRPYSDRLSSDSDSDPGTWPRRSLERTGVRAPAPRRSSRELRRRQRGRSGQLVGRSAPSRWDLHLPEIGRAREPARDVRARIPRAPCAAGGDCSGARCRSWSTERWAVPVAARRAAAVRGQTITPSPRGRSFRRSSRAATRPDSPSPRRRTDRRARRIRPRACRR